SCHQLEAQDVVCRDPVLQAVGTARVGRHVAADRGDHLAGGSGAKKYPRFATARVRERLIRPGWTVAHRFGRSISSTASIRLVPSIAAATGATAPPIRAVPEPRGTIGPRSRRQRLTTLTTSSVYRGRATTSGAPL